MMPDGLDAAFNYLVDNDEGRTYTDDSDDSGGPTKFGITKKTYEEFFGHVVSDSEIENMTPEIAKQIYGALYWSPLHCDDIHFSAFAISIFDTAVLFGVKTVTLLVQQTLVLWCGGTLEIDGLMGDKTVSVLNAIGAQNGFMENFHSLLMDHIDGLVAAHPKNEKYLLGWTRRIDRLLNLA